VQDSCGCPEDDGPSFPWHFGRSNRDNGNDGDDNDIKVDLSNSASVHNTVKVEAETGDNEADGGDGDEGGNGGDAEGDEDRNRNNNHYFSWWSPQGGNENNGGAGGNGGAGAEGGQIVTGTATSFAEIVNVVNRNVTRVSRQ
jgi:hypothetical protein